MTLQTTHRRMACRKAWRTIGLVCILSQSLTIGAHAAPLDQFRQQLRTLSRNSPRSVPTAVATYQRLFKGSPTRDSDQAYVAFRSFYYKVDLGDPTRLTQQVLAENGAVRLMSEGQPYVGEDVHFFTSTFRPFVSVAIQAFLDIREQELQTGFAEDAGLRISMEAVGDRVVTWERYCQTYPTSLLKQDAEQYLRLYLGTFFTGMDNSPLFDWTSHELRPDVKKAYTAFPARHAESRYAGLVRSYSRLIAGCGNRDCPDREAFVKRHGIMSMMAKQPPTR